MSLLFALPPLLSQEPVADWHNSALQGGDKSDAAAHRALALTKGIPARVGAHATRDCLPYGYQENFCDFCERKKTSSQNTRNSTEKEKKLRAPW
jgi:hypothetical protein